MPTFVIDNKVETLDDNGNCPVCNASWDGGAFFDILRKDPYYVGKTDDELRATIKEGWGDENARASRLIGVEIRGKYDGVSMWECPDCRTRWDRFLNK